MAFCAIFVPDFSLQAVVRGEPELKKKPLALLEGRAPIFHVMAMNAAAGALGVKPGLTKAAATEFCGVEIRLRVPEQEIAAHAALLDVAWSFSPFVEDTAPDTVLMDLAGLTTLFGSQENIALQLKARCASLGLEVNIAIAMNSETARVLANANTGPVIVPEGQEACSLLAVPVHLLLTEKGEGPRQQKHKELGEILQSWGVTTCGQLAALPLPALSERLGQEGVRLHAIAGGKGERALILAEPRHSFEESLEIDDAVEELEPLSFLLGRLLDQLCLRLSARALAVRVIRLRMELQPAFEKAFDTKEPLRTRPAVEQFDCQLTLPKPVQDAKLLLKLLRLRLQGNPPKAPVQKLIMCAEPDRPLAVQGGLFLPATPDPEKLELTLARLASVVGEENVGSPEILDSHKAEAFRLRKFSPSSAPEIDKTKNIKMGFRAIRPMPFANVSFQGGQPVRIWFQGKDGNVVHASGPWRTSGEWWEESSWQEDVWDVEIRFAGETEHSTSVYCIVFDARHKKWLVRGSYD